MTRASFRSFPLAVSIKFALGLALVAPCMASAAVLPQLNAQTDALLAVEASRFSLVQQIAERMEAEAVRHGWPAQALQAHLQTLRADQLVAASMSSSLAELEALLASPAVMPQTEWRFMPIAPIKASAWVDTPAAQAYLTCGGGVRA